MTSRVRMKNQFGNSSFEILEKPSVLSIVWGDKMVNYA